MATFARRLGTEGRRRFARVPFGGPVEFSAKADDFLFSVEATGRDISLGGMFIETDIPCTFGELLLVYAALQRGSRLLVLPATVRWTSPSGMGVQFGPLGARDTHQISEFVFRAQS
jgi:type IV pilus assembly protein PilZ